MLPLESVSLVQRLSAIAEARLTPAGGAGGAAAGLGRCGAGATRCTPGYTTGQVGLSYSVSYCTGTIQ